MCTWELRIFLGILLINTDWIKEVQDKSYMPACGKLHFASHIMQADIQTRKYPPLCVCCSWIWRGTLLIKYKAGSLKWFIAGNIQWSMQSSLTNKGTFINLKKHIKIYIKIHINIAPTYFVLRPPSGSLYWSWLKLYLC